ncbi:biotin/lipoate A/B protein ligase family protein [Candidatus Methanomassiliicoccus intestinalis]|uniref:biotin/lipoate A/B protein ligase family protein n=1 Tax=Candidatus Methanomassiliicoccus intestinalis TaxID=1406512 RepID=UPI0037DC767C
MDSGFLSPAYSAAADEILLSKPNSFHIFCRNKTTVSLGYFQKYCESINLELIDSNEVSVIRRMSGGGTIITDPNQIIFCTVLKIDNDWHDLIKDVCECIIRSLKDFEMDASYKPPNDIEINGKKISGSGQVIRNGNLAVQSTLLLKQPELKILKNDKRNGNLTSIYDAIGYIPEINTIKKSISESISNQFEEEMYESKFSKEEKLEIEKLVKMKYSLDSHTFKF